jgi:hypothetical protein
MRLFLGIGLDEKESVFYRPVEAKSPEVCTEENSVCFAST